MHLEEKASWLLEPDIYQSDAIYVKGDYRRHTHPLAECRQECSCYIWDDPVGPVRHKDRYSLVIGMYDRRRGFECPYPKIVARRLSHNPPLPR